MQERHENFLPLIPAIHRQFMIATEGMLPKAKTNHLRAQSSLFDDATANFVHIGFAMGRPCCNMLTGATACAHIVRTHAHTQVQTRMVMPEVLVRIVYA